SSTSTSTCLSEGPRRRSTARRSRRLADSAAAAEARPEALRLLLRLPRREGVVDRAPDERLDALLEVVAQDVGLARAQRALGLWRREVVSAVDRELVAALFADVLRGLQAGVVQCCSVGECAAEQRACGRGEQDLPAVTRGADARGADDVQADVPFVADGGLARVQSHPHLHVDAVGPAVLCKGTLRGDGAGDRVTRAREREEERVALCVDLLAARFRQALAQDAPLLSQHVRVAVAELAEEGRRPLDVREQECDCAAWERAHWAEYAGEPPGAGNQPLPAAARGESRGLVPVGR